MGGTFSSTKKKKTAAPGGISSIDRAVLDLKNSRDRLSRFKTKMSADCNKLLTRAQSIHKNDKDQQKKAVALNLLKLRKFKLKEVESVGSQLLTIEQMITNIQSKEEEKEVLAALRTGKDALQKLHEENSVEDVLKLMEEVEEGIEMEREINDILTNSGSGVDSLSSAELLEVEQELAALENEMLSNDINLPTVPDSKLPDVSNPEKVENVKQPARVAVAS